MSNIQKLFSERIDIFTSVKFTKVSVLTGIIKIALKVGNIHCAYFHCLFLFCVNVLDWFLGVFFPVMPFI